MQFKKMAGAVLAASLISGAAYADIAADVSSGLSAEQIFENARAEGLDIAEIMKQLAAANPELMSSMVTAAIEYIKTVPDVPKEQIDAAMAAVVEAATAAGADRTQMEVTAITAGADPLAVTAATAAGGPNATLPTVPTNAPNVANPFGAGLGVFFAPGLQIAVASPS